jgi:serine/threonine-protein kinase
MGTAQYLAPERITGRHDSPAGDLYSLGIVLYECLAGQPPFDGTTAETMNAHLYRPLPPLPSGTPDPVRELLARLTAKDPAIRLADAGELATLAGRLSAVLEAAPPALPGEPAETAEPEPVPAAASAGPTGPDARPARHNKRRRTLVAATAVVVFAVLSGMLASGALRVTTRPGQAAPGPAPHVTAPSRGAAGDPGGTGEPSATPATPKPSQKASPARHSGRGQDGSAGQGGHPASTPTSAESTPTPAPRRGSTGSGSTNSGGGVQLQVPGTGIGVSLNL